VNRFLVDTQALLWWLTEDDALSPTARELLVEPANEFLFSAASVWEIAIKRSLGKLTAPDDLPDRIVDEGFSWLAITPAHAWRVGDLPAHHRDPFDRLLIAQALTERVPIVTADARFSDYGVDVRW
jgi:PIN domain nuclease of toxin-antitoxin system